MLMVLENGIRWRGAFDQSAQICEVPRDANKSWLASSYFEQCFKRLAAEWFRVAD